MIETSLAVTHDGETVAVTGRFDAGSVGDRPRIVWVLGPREHIDGKELLPPGWYVSVKAPGEDTAHLYFDSADAAGAAADLLVGVKSAAVPGIPALNGELAGVSFFHFASAYPAMGERIYETAFRNRQLTGIAAEVWLQFPATVTSVPFMLRVRCRDAEGTVLKDENIAYTASAGWTDGAFSTALQPPPGGWREGTYTVEVLHDENLLGTAQFRVTP
jgi:hypothetical protein